MRFERLWSTERTIFDWPLEFSLNICVFFVCGGWGGLLVLTIDLPPELICSLYGHLRPKAVGYQGLHRTTVRFCSPHARELSPFRTEGMILARLFRNDCRLISQVCVVPRCVTLCGKGDYCLLSVFVKSPAARGATRYSGSQENPEEGQLTFTRRATKPRKLRINFKTEAHKFWVWNIRIHDSQRTADDIHLVLQNVQKGWVTLNFFFHLKLFQY